MPINSVEQVPFAQIANAALRDSRLSFRARGILSMVLSNTGEWEAPARWILEQSDKEGREAIQTALNELTEVGYREVTHERDSRGRLRTITLWKHQPTASPESRPTGSPPTGEAVQHSEHYLSEHYLSEHHEEPAQEPDQRTETRTTSPKGDETFDMFWKLATRKTGKGAARKALTQALTRTDLATIAPAWTQANTAWQTWPDKTKIPHPTTWLNQERWDDEPPSPHLQLTQPKGQAAYEYLKAIEDDEPQRSITATQTNLLHR